jgi:hypothetical protein
MVDTFFVTGSIKSAKLSSLHCLLDPEYVESSTFEADIADIEVAALLQSFLAIHDIHVDNPFELRHLPVAKNRY